MEPRRAKFVLKLFFIICVLLCFGAAFASGILFLLLEKPPEPPVLVAEPMEKDFGTIGECFNRQIVKLTNRSETTLEILHTVKSCSCTDVSLSVGKIPPGQSVEMGYIFDSYGRQGDNNGHIAVAYHIQGQEESSPKYVTVRFKAFVDPEITKNRPLPLPVTLE